jgi:hypothetical protein
VLFFGFDALPVQPTQSNTTSAPAMRPGTRPAKKGVSGNGSHLQSSIVELLLADSVVGVGAFEALLVDEEVDELVVELDEDADAPGNEPANLALSTSMLH